MNIYATIILVTILIEDILEIISSYLNLTHLSPVLPDIFKKYYDPKKYALSQEYTMEKTIFGLITGTLELAFLLGFWFVAGFNWLDTMVRSWGHGDITNGLLFIGILTLTQSLISIPFSYYSTFVIEEKYGFNKTSHTTFITDYLKGILLTIIIGGPILAGLLWFFISAGSFAWLYVWLFISIAGLAIQYIAPTWIMPLFNKFTPLADGELKSEILAMTKKANFPLQGLYVIDGSKRSTKSNAFFTGFGKNKRIALYDTLINNHTVNELLGVLAHEIGHYKKKHLLKGMIIGFVHTGILMFLLSLFMQKKELFEAFYMNEMSVYAGLLFFSMLFAPIEFILGIFMNILSRKHEYEADAFSANITGKPGDLSEALLKMSVDNLSNVTPHPFYVFLNYSHPPVLNRIQALAK